MARWPRRCGWPSGRWSGDVGGGCPAGCRLCVRGGRRRGAHWRRTSWSGWTPSLSGADGARLGRPAVDVVPHPRIDHWPVRGGGHPARGVDGAAAAGLVVPDAGTAGGRAGRRRGRGLEDGGVAAGKRIAAATGAWIAFEDEAGQSLRPPRAHSWGRRGRTPVVRVRGAGSGRVSIVGLVCFPSPTHPGCCTGRVPTGDVGTRRRASPGGTTAI